MVIYGDRSNSTPLKWLHTSIYTCSFIYLFIFTTGILQMIGYYFILIFCWQESNQGSHVPGKCCVLSYCIIFLMFLIFTKIIGATPSAAQDLLLALCLFVDCSKWCLSDQRCHQGSKLTFSLNKSIFNCLLLVVNFLEGGQFHL